MRVAPAGPVSSAGRVFPPDGVGKIPKPPSAFPRGRRPPAPLRRPDLPSATDTPPAADVDRPAVRPETRYRFRLFVAGQTPLSMRVRDNFQRFVADPLGDRVDLDLVDLVQDPRRARTERIVATPTLVRLEPAPVVRLVGDLADFERVRSLVLVGEDYPEGLNPGDASPGGNPDGANHDGAAPDRAAPPRPGAGKLGAGGFVQDGEIHGPGGSEPGEQDSGDRSIEPPGG